MSAPTSGQTDAPGVGLGDAGPGASPRLLSVAEVQQALRDLRAQPQPQTSSEADRHVTSTVPSTTPRHRAAPSPKRRSERARRAPSHSGGDTGSAVVTARGDVTREAGRARGDKRRTLTGWVTVAAAHAGAGASTVALAIADAGAETGQGVHLIEATPPYCSGMVAAASAELGCDADDSWRRGQRGNVVIDRWATDAAIERWPSPPRSCHGATVVDLGLLDGRWSELPEDLRCTVVVCRPTVPGIRLTEHLLGLLAEQPLAVAAIGPSRWPGEATAGLGPRLRALRDAGRVVAVPLDRHLGITGLTAEPLPRAVRAAGGALVQLTATGTRTQSTPAMPPRGAHR
jgi:hypothetical protein